MIDLHSINPTEVLNLFNFKPIVKDLKAFRSVVLKLQRRVILNQLESNHKRSSILVKFHNKFLENYLGDVV